MGLRQLVTDRRVWIRRTPDGILILHDHVDDTRMTWTGESIGSSFYIAWAIEFNSPPEPEELSEDFTGLRHHRLGQWRTEVSCLGVIKSRRAPGRPPSTSTRTLRMSHARRCIDIANGVATREEPPDPRVGAHRTETGRHCRFHSDDGAPRRLLRILRHREIYQVQRLTQHGSTCYYVYATSSHTRRSSSSRSPQERQPLMDGACSTCTDSSHGNAEGGRSYGGFVLLCPGPTDVPSRDEAARTDGGYRTGGAIAWKCFAPPEGDDSSAAAELRNVVTALKYTIAARIIQIDLDIELAPTQPTDVYTDAQAVLDGKGGERMPKSSRWMGARYAMVRHAETQSESRRQCRRHRHEMPRGGRHQDQPREDPRPTLLQHGQHRCYLKS